jgi:hypothetical protein
MDHIARAEALRQRANACQSLSDETTSSKFKDCYSLLAKNYEGLAQMEENYAAASERMEAASANGP